MVFQDDLVRVFKPIKIGLIHIKMMSPKIYQTTSGYVMSVAGIIY